jgi:hypothetical protein
MRVRTDHLAGWMNPRQGQAIAGEYSKYQDPTIQEFIVKLIELRSTARVPAGLSRAWLVFVPASMEQLPTPKVIESQRF